MDVNKRRALEIALFSEPKYWLDDSPAKLSNSILPLTKRAIITKELLADIEERARIQAESVGVKFIRLVVEKESVVTLIFEDTAGYQTRIGVPQNAGFLPNSQ